MLTFLGLNACSNKANQRNLQSLNIKEIVHFVQVETQALKTGLLTGHLPYDELIGKGRTNLGGYIGGFVHKANALGDVEVVGINSPDFVFGGSSRVGILLKASNILWISF